MDQQKISYVSGWYPEEKGEFLSFRWMKKKAVVEISNIDRSRKNSFLMFIGGHPFPDSANPVLNLRMNGKAIGEAEILHSKNTYLYPIRLRNNFLHLELVLNSVFANEKGIDERELGMIVYEIAVHSLRKPPLPTSLELETTTFCDINPPCVMCYARMLHTRPSQENKNLDDTVFEKVQPHLKKFEVISLHGIGEPLAGKKLFPILRSIDSNKTKLQFNSNGLNLNEEKCRGLVENGLSLVNFSVDAATAETYKKIRRADFHKVVANIRRLSEIKKEMSSRRPRIEMNMTLMRSNFEEANQFVHLAKDLGAESVHLGILNKHSDDYAVQNENFVFHYHQEMIDLSSPALGAKIQEARETARVLGISLFINMPKA
jgi:wyosine [tRNA(Phe)-imidazoG37] synthetase (radical SAM superfamily)